MFDSYFLRDLAKSLAKTYRIKPVRISPMEAGTATKADIERWEKAELKRKRKNEIRASTKLQHLHTDSRDGTLDTKT